MSKDFLRIIAIGDGSYRLMGDPAVRLNQGHPGAYPACDGFSNFAVTVLSSTPERLARKLLESPGVPRPFWPLQTSVKIMPSSAKNS